MTGSGHGVSIKRYRQMGAILAGCAVVAASPTLAQETSGRAAAPKPTESSQAAEPSDIVVTAEKRESTVQRTPISISAISGDALRQQGVTDLKGIIAQVPGVSFRSSGPGQTEIEIRGLASSGGSSATVGFYLDETALAPPILSGSGKVVIDPNLFDLNRVEVLRGPQGTLYGSGSEGGTVKLITNKPNLSAVQAAVDGTGSYTFNGSFNGALNAMINLPLVADKVAVRVVGTIAHNSGFIDRIVLNDFPRPSGTACGSPLACVRGDVRGATIARTDEDVNSNDFIALRGSITLQPTEELKIDAQIYYQRQTADGYTTYDSDPGLPILAHYQASDFTEPFADEFRLYSLTANYDLGFATLTANGSFWHREQMQTQETTEAVQSVFNAFYGVDRFVPNTFAERDTARQKSGEIRLASNGNGRFRWIAGLYYSNLDSTYADTNEAVGLADVSVGGVAANPRGILYNSDNFYNLTQYAAFGEVSYGITDSLRLTGGLRYYQFDLSGTQRQNGITTTSGNADFTTTQATVRDTGFNPRINLSYEPSRDLTLYATVARGFRPGGFNLPIPDYCDLRQGTFGPDSVISYEVGEKAKLFDRKLTINASAFYIKWNQVQQNLNQACGFILITNAGSARSYGGEIEASAQLTPELSLSLTGGYTKANLSQVDPTLTAANPLTRAGLPLLNIPEFTGSSALSYRRPMGKGNTFVGRFQHTYVSASTDLSAFYTRLRPYNIFGARVGVEGERFGAYLFADNLTDKRAELSVNTTSFSFVIPSLTRVSTNQPRTIGINLSYKY